MLDLETLQHHVMLGAKNVWSMLAYDPSAPMLFSSGLFWLLFILILPVYVALKSSKSKMVFFIVLFSLYFYYKSSGLFFLMLIGTSWSTGSFQFASAMPPPPGAARHGCGFQSYCRYLYWDISNMPTFSCGTGIRWYMAISSLLM